MCKERAGTLVSCRDSGKEQALEQVVVGGGAGFIGSQLCAALLEDGFAVVCIDNLMTGSLRNIAPIRDHPAFEFVEHDIALLLPERLRPAQIYHLASPASVPDYLGHPIETLRTNSLGTMTMLELARASGARFLFTSTSEIYGDPLVHPQTEDYWGNTNPVGPRACYDEGKRFGEALTMEYRRSYGLDVRVVRIFNTYGPHSRPNDGRIVPNFVVQALRREPITIYGDGTQTRSFCYVSDMVRGLRAAMDAPNTAGEVFNLGNPDEYTVNEFATVIGSLLGSNAGVVYLPLPVDDPVRRRPDISKARSILGWQPEVELATGIKHTAAWFREILDLGESDLDSEPSIRATAG